MKRIIKTFSLFKKLNNISNHFHILKQIIKITIIYIILVNLKLIFLLALRLDGFVKVKSQKKKIFLKMCQELLFYQVARVEI